jgi:hypothetical protein
MIASGNDTKVYNLMLFTNLNLQLFLCTFNCTIKDKKLEF